MEINLARTLCLLVDHVHMRDYHRLRRTCTFLRDDMDLRNIVPHLEVVQSSYVTKSRIVHVVATIRFVSNDKPYDIRKYWQFGVTIGVSLGQPGHILTSSEMYKFYMAVSTTTYAFRACLDHHDRAFNLEYYVRDFTFPFASSSPFVCSCNTS